eukprot:5926439-Amphidinium_carterae.1
MLTRVRGLGMPQGPGDMELHQLLCKYCDVASNSWHPVPESHGKAVSSAKAVSIHDVLDDRVSGWVSRFSRMETTRENLTREELLECVEEACEAYMELLAGGHEQSLDLATILARNIDAVVCHYLDAGEHNDLRKVLLKLQETTAKAGVELPPLARKIVLEARHPKHAPAAAVQTQKSVGDMSWDEISEHTHTHWYNGVNATPKHGIRLMGVTHSELPAKEAPPFDALPVLTAMQGKSRGRAGAHGAACIAGPVSTHQSC